MKVKNIFRLPEEKLTSGDIGVEIEVEGRRLPDIRGPWKMTIDHSLRGPENMEYVLRKPLSLAGVRKSLDALDTAYKDNNTEVFETVRAGVHVHINVQNLSLVELYNFLTLYFIFEEVLVKFCGEHREGNLFCLRASDAGFVLEALKFAIRRKRFGVLAQDDLRYGSVNVKALSTFGSLEFRAMRGTRDLDLIYQWCGILLNLRDKAITFEDPVDVITGFSGAGVRVFAKNIFEGFFPLISGGCQDFEGMVINGMRNAQDIAYCVNWEEIKNPVKKNPFKPVWDMQYAQAPAGF